jgi:hypothetical protein
LLRRQQSDHNAEAHPAHSGGRRHENSDSAHDERDDADRGAAEGTEQAVAAEAHEKPRISSNA